MRTISLTARAWILVLVALAFPRPLVFAEVDVETDREKLLERAVAPFSGDLPERMKRRMIRVLVSYSRTNYFVDRGRQRGFEFELFQEYEKFLNDDAPRGKLPVHVVYIPMPFDELIPALLDGRGDAVAAGLTVTPERSRKVSFTKPYLSRVDEVVVTSTTTTDIRKIEHLAGRPVYVSSGSSYAQHLKEVSDKLSSAGLEPISISHLGDHLETEEYLELVHAGIVETTVADAHIARLWKPVLDNIRIHDNLQVHSRGKIAWAIRRENTQLREHLGRFADKNRKGTVIGNIPFKRYYKNTKWARNPLGGKERARLERLIHYDLTP